MIDYPKIFTGRRHIITHRNFTNLIKSWIVNILSLSTITEFICEDCGTLLVHSNPTTLESMRDVHNQLCPVKRQKLISTGLSPTVKETKQILASPQSQATRYCTNSSTISRISCRSTSNHSWWSDHHIADWHRDFIFKDRRTH